jgi:hypothetical protein
LQAGGHGFESHYLHRSDVYIFSEQRSKIKLFLLFNIGVVSVKDGQGTPVPIPNTEVKLFSAEDTELEAAWENR